MRKDGQTDTTKLKVALRSFKNVIKNIQYFLCEVPCNSEGNCINNLTLCVPCIILQCVNDQRDAQFL
jgi:hypothetical protein